MTANAKERVIFRVWIEDGEVIAYFPDTYGDESVCNPGMMLSYMHVGQLGEASYTACLPATRPAEPEEYAELLEELRERGYADLKVVKRWNVGRRLGR